MARITLTQVAGQAGVSVGTASLVLNGRWKEKRLSEDCVSRVRDAANQLGYRGSYHARTLHRGKAMTLGFVTRFHEQDMSRPGVETGLTDEANRRGYEILNIVLTDGEAALQRAVRYVQEGRLDGFAVFMGGWSSPEITDRIPPEVPMTHIWFAPDGFKPVVTLDPGPGIACAAEHLAELGHRRVAWLGLTTPQGLQVPERLEAFQAAARNAGIDVVEHRLAVNETPRRDTCTVHRFHRQLSADMDWLEGTTAAMCYNDTMATALGIALRDRGVRPGEDFSLVGFDDTQAIYAAPPLTTVSHMFARMGAEAVRVLEEMIAGPGRRPPTVTKIPSKLVIRESTCPPAAGSNFKEGLHHAK
jgi:LacI family transcriptional regulator